MESKIDLKKIDTHIQEAKKQILALKEMGDDFPSLSSNTARIQASLKMLELNISDLTILDLNE
jgi:hypothetical protein